MDPHLIDMLQGHWIVVHRGGDPNALLASLGFRPAFLDFSTMTLYISRFKSGEPAPGHVLEGLPDDAVAIRSPCGCVIAPKATLIRGYERNGYFFTMSTAARAAQEWLRFA
jgi:hypothetical protein